jgi:hypothetical protein
MTAALRAQFEGKVCTFGGHVGKGSSPVLNLCRKLVAAGIDPATSMEVNRGRHRRCGSSRSAWRRV